MAVSIILNGKKTACAAGETILAVARRQGIRIPTLCSHEALQPYGACRLCIVEVAHNGRKQVQTSCTTAVREGMRVNTQTRQIAAIRKTLAALLAARAPDAPVVQALARELGVTKTALPKGADRCIMCGLCVRTCHEVVGAGALCFARKGSRREVAVPFYRNSQECIGCGSCVFVCPTGAVSMHDAPPDAHGAVRSMDTWKTELPLQRCTAHGGLFAPRRMLEHFAARYPVGEGFLEQCPACRQNSKKSTTR
jgi:predicted molibdopterin-dependent oxidoreductase YjgC